MADTYYARFFDANGAAVTGSNGQTWFAIPDPNIDISGIVSPAYSQAFAFQSITLGSDPVAIKLFNAVTGSSRYREVEIAHYGNGHLLDAYQFTAVNPSAMSIDFDSGAQQLDFAYGGIRAAHYKANGSTISIQTHDLIGHSAPLKASDGTTTVAAVTPSTAEPVASNTPVASQDTYVRFMDPSTGQYLIAADGSSYFYITSTGPLVYQNAIATNEASGIKISDLNFTIDPASLTAAQQGTFIPSAYSTVIVASYSIPADGTAGHFIEGGGFTHAVFDRSGSDPSTGEYNISFRTADLVFAGNSSSAASDGSVNGFSGASWLNQHHPGDNHPCYCTGTLILTSRGEVPVETLRIGDIAVTASGERRPIRWIGHRRTDIARHPRPEKVMPVRILAGAMAPGVPLRDLRVSPGHAVAVDGVLVKAERLVNGGSIVHEAISHVTYWHVELDSHDLLVADGLGAESYVECGNRHAFENGGPVTTLHPDFDSLVEHAAQSCLPLIDGGAALAAIRERLIARAGDYFIVDPMVSLVADGVALVPSSVLGRRYEFLVPGNTRSLRLVSRSAIAGDVLARSTDRRRLGIAVRELAIDGVAIACDDLCEGWHAQAPGRDHRWSDGDAAIPFGHRVAFAVIALDRYPAANTMRDRCVA